MIAAPADRIWPLLVDPRPLASAGEHPVTVELPEGFLGVEGDQWVEVHGPECDDDRVPCRVLVATPFDLLRVSSKQRGIRQTIEHRLTSHGDHTFVEETITFAPTFAGRPLQHLMPWCLLVTGLLAWVARGMSDTLDLIEAAVAE